MCRPPNLRPAPFPTGERRGTRSPVSSRLLWLCGKIAPLGSRLAAAAELFPSASGSSRHGVALWEVTAAAPHSLCPPELLCLRRDPFSSHKGSRRGHLVLSLALTCPHALSPPVCTSHHAYRIRVLVVVMFVSTSTSINALYLRKHPYHTHTCI